MKKIPIIIGVIVLLVGVFFFVQYKTPQHFNTSCQVTTDCALVNIGTENSPYQSCITRDQRIYRRVENGTPNIAPDICVCEQQTCRGVLYLQPQKISDCDYFTNDTKEICYYKTAVKFNDSSLCDKLAPSRRKFVCEQTTK